MSRTGRSRSARKLPVCGSTSQLGIIKPLGVVKVQRNTGAVLLMDERRGYLANSARSSADRVSEAKAAGTQKAEGE